MTDYKELIINLRLFSLSLCGKEASITQTAADVIEQLMDDYEILAKMYAKVSEDLCIRTKKLDMAMIDLEFGRYCTTCLNYKIKNCPPNKCLTDNNDKWVWRGVSINEND